MLCQNIVMVVCTGGHRLLGGVLYPLGGAQLLDQLLSVLKLALEAPDHGVQKVVPGVPQSLQYILGTKLLWPQLVIRPTTGLPTSWRGPPVQPGAALE